MRVSVLWCSCESEACSLHRRVQRRRWQYYVHYVGYDRSEDEWVGSDRVQPVVQAVRGGGIDACVHCVTA